MAWNPYAKNHIGNPAIKYREGGPGHLSGIDRMLAQQQLRANMIEISGDPSGTDPDGYLSPEDLETLQNFKNFADDVDWAGASPIELRDTRHAVTPVWSLYAAANGLIRRGLHKATHKNKNYTFRDYQPERVVRERKWLWNVERPPVWVTPRTTATAGLTKAIFLRKGQEVHSGFVIGSLGTTKAYTQLVAFCDDGKLRSWRGLELERSYGFGWGRLPDKDLIENVLAPGNAYAVDHTNAYSKSLRDILVDQIPDDKLPRNASGKVDLSAYGL